MFLTCNKNSLKCRALTTRNCYEGVTAWLNKSTCFTLSGYGKKGRHRWTSVHPSDVHCLKVVLNYLKLQIAKDTQMLNLLHKAS